MSRVNRLGLVLIFMSFLFLISIISGSIVVIPERVKNVFPIVSSMFVVGSGLFCI
jgi:hypothetical protein